MSRAIRSITDSISHLPLLGHDVAVSAQVPSTPPLAHRGRLDGQDRGYVGGGCEHTGGLREEPLASFVDVDDGAAYLVVFIAYRARRCGPPLLAVDRSPAFGAPPGKHGRAGLIGEPFEVRYGVRDLVFRFVADWVPAEPFGVVDQVRDECGDRVLGWWWDVAFFHRHPRPGDEDGAEHVPGFEDGLLRWAASVRTILSRLRASVWARGR